MRTKLLLAAAVTPLILFASCTGSPVSQGSSTAATTEAMASSSTGSAGGNGGAGGTSLLSGSGVFSGSGTGGGCGTSDAGADASTGCEGLEGGVTYGGDVATIFLQNCSGELCHSTPTYAGLVNVPAPECCDGELYVKPGDADHSYVVDKITGQGICFGSRMPFGQPPLADADILTIRRWICEGAPDD